MNSRFIIQMSQKSRKKCDVNPKLGEIEIRQALFNMKQSPAVATQSVQQPVLKATQSVQHPPSKPIQSIQQLPSKPTQSVRQPPSMPPTVHNQSFNSNAGRGTTFRNQPLYMNVESPSGPKKVRVLWTNQVQMASDSPFAASFGTSSLSPCTSNQKDKSNLKEPSIPPKSLLLKNGSLTSDKTSETITKKVQQEKRVKPVVSTSQNIVKTNQKDEYNQKLTQTQPVPYIPTQNNAGSELTLKETLSNFEKVWMERIEKKIDHLTKAVNRMSMKKRGGKQGTPPFLPFKTLKDFEEFNEGTQEVFDELVDYLVYLGGGNPDSCASLYFKEAFHEEEQISRHITWLGIPNKKILALHSTRFVNACEEAMKRNIDLSGSKRTQFVDGMNKALRSLKERYRKRSLAVVSNSLNLVQMQQIRNANNKNSTMIEQSKPNNVDPLQLTMEDDEQELEIKKDYCDPLEYEQSYNQKQSQLIFLQKEQKQNKSKSPKINQQINEDWHQNNNEAVETDDVGEAEYYADYPNIGNTSYDECDPNSNLPLDSDATLEANSNNPYRADVDSDMEYDEAAE